jgi:hypothetical protein
MCSCSRSSEADLVSCEGSSLFRGVLQLLQFRCFFSVEGNGDAAPDIVLCLVSVNSFGADLTGLFSLHLLFVVLWFFPDLGGLLLVLPSRKR